MGEDRAAEDNIICNQHDCIHLGLEYTLDVETMTVRLHSLGVDKLICVYSNASGYNKCKNYLTLGKALMIKSEDIRGEMSIAS